MSHEQTLKDFKLVVYRLIRHLEKKELTDSEKAMIDGAKSFLKRHSSITDCLRNEDLNKVQEPAQVACRLDQQQCQQECEHKSDRTKCPFTQANKVQQGGWPGVEKEEMIKGLREIRQYFMHHDQTPQQHHLFNLAKRFINVLKFVDNPCDAIGHYGGDPKREGVCPKCGKEW